jgi:hypothetical protein
VERGVRDALADLGRQVFDVTFALSEHVDDLGATTVGERLRDLGEPVESADFAACLSTFSSHH